MKRSPAIIVALLALAAALSGSAYAAIKIGTNNIKNGAVTAGKVSANALPDLRMVAPSQDLSSLTVVNEWPQERISQRTSGVTAVRRQSPGIYCMTLAQSVADRFFDNTGQPIRTTVASVEYVNTLTAQSTVVMVRGASNTCNPYEVEIHTDAPYK